MKFYTCDKSERGGTFKKYFTPTKISENIRKTPEGFLVCVGVPIARTGEMEYGVGETPLEPGENGKVIVDRSEKEVFDPRVLASFEGKPVTIRHPKDFVSPKNWKDLAVGIVQNVRRGEGDQKNDLIADLLITDSTAISLVESGLREVSCGYEAEYEQTAEGRGIQLNIIGNHLALVEEGRAGSSYAINDHKEGEPEMDKKAKKSFIDRMFAAVKSGALTKDEALKAADALDAEESKEKEEKAKDASSMDAEGMAKILGAVDALTKKVDSLMGKDKAPVEKEEKADDADVEVEASGDEEVASGIEGRLTKIEAMLAKLMGTGDEEEIIEDESEEESEDDDYEESAMAGDKTGDQKTVDADVRAKAEILVPGIKLGKNPKAEVLAAFAKTTDGKEVMKIIAGGKLTFDSKEKVDLMFNAAAEVMKMKRTKTFARSKSLDSKAVGSEETKPKVVMTPAMINQKNEEKYKTH